MATFNSHQNIIKKLQALSHKLAEDKLSLEELGEFQSLAQELYERTVILNYKAKEEKVYQETGTKADTKPNASKESEVKEAPVEKEESTGIMFDFSSEETDTDEDVIKEEPKEEATDSKADNIEVSEPEVEEVKEEKSEKTTVTHTHKTEISNDDTVISFYQKFTKVHDDSLMDVLASQKLDTLKGALGLNDKMQIISELFEGNSSAFENAIEKLDQQDSDEKARITLSEIAAQHQWEPDHVLVEDFAKLVERRYAK